MIDDRNRPEGDDLDIEVSPVDEEFAEPGTAIPAPPSPLPRVTSVPIPTRRPHFAHSATPASVAAPRSALRMGFETLVVTLVAWLFAVTFVVQPVEVPSGSMLNTILVGDHLIVNRMLYGTPRWLAPVLPFREIRRGDVVVFRHPNEPEHLYVKRVVGLPGETIEIYGARVYVDGKELPETRAVVADSGSDNSLEVTANVPTEGATYTVYFSHLRDLGGDDGGLGTLASADRGTFGVGRPFTIPAGHYFSLGDNRDNSQDSRFWGTVPGELVVGRAVLVYWSSDRTGGRGLGQRLRLGRFGTLIQ